MPLLLTVQCSRQPFILVGKDPCQGWHTYVASPACLQGSYFAKIAGKLTAWPPARQGTDDCRPGPLPWQACTLTSSM